MPIRISWVCITWGLGNVVTGIGVQRKSNANPCFHFFITNNANRKPAPAHHAHHAHFLGLHYTPGPSLPSSSGLWAQTRACQHRIRRTTCAHARPIGSRTRRTCTWHSTCCHWPRGPRRTARSGSHRRACCKKKEEKKNDDVVGIVLDCFGQSCVFG
jgi:hypothetical protein